MARAFTSADVIQHNSGTDSLTASPGTTLPNPTAEDNGGIVVMGALSVLAAPEQWHVAAQSGTNDASPIMGIVSRPDLPGGETSWSFLSNGGGSTYWTWLVEEWTNLSFTAQWASARTLQVIGPASISTGTTGSADSAFYAVIAAVFLVGSGNAGAGPWPSSTSWSNGFTETDVMTIGPGNTASSFQLRVARLYETDPSTGPWETTCTFDVTQTDKPTTACIAAFRAEDQVETPAASVITT